MTDQQAAALQTADEFISELWKLTWKTLTALMVTVAVVVGIGLGVQVLKAAGLVPVKAKAVDVCRK